MYANMRLKRGLQTIKAALKPVSRQVSVDHHLGTNKANLSLAFVIPWFGKDSSGGAESDCRDLVVGLKKYRPDIHVDVLSTCLRDFNQDWNDNYYKEGVHFEYGNRVLRFEVEPFNRDYFHQLNARLLGTDKGTLKKGISPLSEEEERYFYRHMVHSFSMYRFIKKFEDAYDYFVFMPYLFGTTIKGLELVPHKSIVIPCLHNEAYAYIGLYKSVLEKARGYFFNASGEQELAGQLADIPKDKQFLLGVQVDIDVKRHSGDDFRARHGLKRPYIIYVGRKLVGKKLDKLVEQYLGSSLHEIIDLVVIGRGDLDYSEYWSKGVKDCGFVGEGEKLDAMAGALALCQPSDNESFSIVLMEAWLQGTPSIVNERCAVTTDHVRDSQGGYTYGGTASLESAVQDLLDQPEKARNLAENGRRYVVENYSPQKIIGKFVEYIGKIDGNYA